MNIKNHSLPILLLLAAVAAVTLLPVSASVASISLTATGLLGTLSLDYGRAKPRPLAPVLAFEPAGAPAGGQLGKAA